MTNAMTLDEYLDALRRDGPALADAAEAAGLRARVAACPDWDVADLVWHIGEVHDFWRTIVERRLTDPAQAPEDLARPADPDLVAWYREGIDRLVAVLAAGDPATPVWSWSARKDIGFVQRRMPQETAVHRWDAEAAAGRPHEVERALALDGVDEFLDLFTADVREGAEPIGGTVHLHATDGEGEWLVTPAGDGLDIRRGHAEGDATVRGTASDLLLLLWRRRGPAGVEVRGDAGVLDRFLARTNLD